MTLPRTLLIIDKRANTVEPVTDEYVAAGRIFVQDVRPGDISWQIKRTGRYDSERYIIIPLQPEE